MILRLARERFSEKESQNHANGRKLSIQRGVCFGLKLGDVSLSYKLVIPTRTI